MLSATLLDGSACQLHICECFGMHTFRFRPAASESDVLVSLHDDGAGC